MEICAMQVQKNEGGPIMSNVTSKRAPRGSSAHPEAGESAGLIRTDASNYGALPGYFIERYMNQADFPRADAEELLVEYAQMMHARVTSGGGPDFDWRRLSTAE